MNEQTAEEKLRQTLEGGISGPARRTQKKASVEDTADSFMEDFGKKLEQSLHVNDAPKKEIRIKKEKTESAPKVKKIIKPIETATPVATEPEIKIEEQAVEPKLEIIEEKIKEPEIESEPDIQETEPEIIEEVHGDSEPVIIEEQQEASAERIEEPVTESEPEIQEADEAQESEIIEPVIESEQETEPVTVQEEPQELPEIPLISENDEEENEIPDADENFEDNNGDDGLPEIPVISAEEPQEQETFSPSADVVLNVAEEIPEQPGESESEGDSVPVSVAMPEDTKTAEDKLMADIAEAMTGNPLTLESSEPLEPYKIPEDFLNEVSSDPSKQSAEEKLISNIAQAMSESPLEAAADNAAKNFEDELENLDENLAASFPDHEEPLTEEIDLSAYEEDEPETQEPVVEVEDSPEKPEPEIEPAFDEVPIPEPVDEPEPEPAEEPEEIIEEAQEKEQEEPGIIEEPVEPVPEESQDENKNEELKTESTPEIPKPETETENDINVNEIEETPEDVNAVDDVNDENNNEDSETSLLEEMPELKDAMAEPETEGDILTPELSLAADDDGLGEPEKTDETETYEFSLLGEKSDTEVSKENDMPEQSLIEENEHEHDDAEGFDMGVLGDAVSFGDHEHEENAENIDSFESTGNDFGFDENSPSHGGFISPDPGEEQEKEKVMGLREKVTKRIKVGKSKNDGGENSGSNRSGILMPLLLIALLGVGGFIAWQLMQLNKNLSGNMPGVNAESNSVTAESNPSYEYAVDFIFDSNLSGRMAQRGQEGWQVVGSRRTQDSITGQLGYEFIFMRKAPVK